MTTEQCPVCSEKGALGLPAGVDRVAFACKVCGWFLVSGTALGLLKAGEYKPSPTKRRCWNTRIASCEELAVLRRLLYRKLRA
jgi:hypothetical protein